MIHRRIVGKLENFDEDDRIPLSISSINYYRFIVSTKDDRIASRTPLVKQSLDPDSLSIFTGCNSTIISTRFLFQMNILCLLDREMYLQSGSGMEEV